MGCCALMWSYCRHAESPVCWGQTWRRGHRVSVPCRACAWVDEVHGSCGFTLSQGRAATVDTPTATSPRLTVAKAAATAQTPTSPGHLWSISSSVRHFANTERHISKNKIKPPQRKFQKRYQVCVNTNLETQVP